MFLQQIQKVLLFFSVLVLLVSCSEYQQLLRKGELAKKYAAAEEYYANADYKKAIGLYELIIPLYRGKPQAERILFHEADSYFQLEDYFIASYKMDRFVSSYPKSDKVEEASFKAARSLYDLSPRYSLDQKETIEAIDKFQKLITDYPESKYLDESNKYAADLRKKLEQKYYSIAKRYHHRDLHKAAIKAFSNYLSNYPGSEYTEKALYYRLESAYDLAINSFNDLIPERLSKAKEYYESYSKYSKTENLEEKAQKISDDINKRLQAVN